MPEKTTKAEKRYEVNGKQFVWTPEPEDDERLPDVALPLRVKLKVIRQMTDRLMDADTQAEILESIAPAHAETMAEMDLNDFQAMFMAWQEEYQRLSGATLGE